MGQNFQEDATAVAELVSSGAASPDEMLDEALARVAALNPALNAVVLINEEAARAAIRQGLPDGPFRGVPFLIKDLGAEAQDFPSNNGSNLLRDTRYSYDSEIFLRMRATGVVTFGRTTSPEGGIGPVTEAAVYGGPTRNPWDVTRTSGGSSGGSGAAVAAGIVPMAHGSDGGGSVRIPASSCGLFGFKPTRARLPDGPASGEGWAGMATDGFLTRSVRDNAAMMDACAGPDLGAPYAAPEMEMAYGQAIQRPPKRLRIALCYTTFTGKPIGPDCKAAVEKTAKLLSNMGHDVIPHVPQADHEGMMHAWTKIVACGTASWIDSTLNAKGRALQQGDIQGVAESAHRMAQGISGAEYLNAVNKIHSYGREMAAVFGDYDIILSSTLAEPPAAVGRFTHDRDDYENYRVGAGGVFEYSPFCATFNASGQPAASVPMHWTDEGLPVGIHLAAAFGQDATLIALCAELEQAAPWANRKPAMLTEYLA
ncbi:Amidase [Sulfitobacter noctilucicola]|uniref:Amidase/6-aminohexanoate-cyclic-dimer hydrolase n=1 Tax=Sulfitobacter noctilucicola TaxID=1342301 RepID=A0A7W6M7G8_9RHOB|nr:amidase [Sulfitobacter noctilucicola]KIN64981.1 Amidase [Sulfitobacter noctilucicola]MBB4173878.1 amidase/6-aminohexanoate-cyclic-dimer hydrolase [Sulfitobacter noctilucicola]